jgi:hypothetical protein
MGRKDEIESKIIHWIFPLRLLYLPSRSLVSSSESANLLETDLSLRNEKAN